MGCGGVLQVLLCPHSPVGAGCGPGAAIRGAPPPSRGSPRGCTPSPSKTIEEGGGRVP